jgi:diaminopropionate ammonia-lyase
MIVTNARRRSVEAAARIIDRIIDPAERVIAWDSITQWPGYAITPLHDLAARAAELGIARLGYKDEAPRFGLKSFKALGGAFAVQRHLQAALAERLREDIPLPALLNGTYRNLTRDLTVAAATDGNHGRAVAWGAKLFGCRARIYIHETVSPGRAAAIAAYGAEVVRVPGVYEDALRRCEADARAAGWTVISDTAYPGCMEVPRTVMAGYTVMVTEAASRWHESGRGVDDPEPPTHVFIQAGVGGLAAAVTASMHSRYGEAMPRIVVVEPERADCCYQSARLGRWTPATGDLDTICAGLACGEASLLAWEILDAAAFAFMTVPDILVAEQMRRLAAPHGKDAPIVAGESAACGLAGLVQALAEPAQAAALGLDKNSRALVFGSEGDTDSDLYKKLTLIASS